jgi:photosystem II stability/assembly factor-like uncharacterized protein
MRWNLTRLLRLAGFALALAASGAPALLAAPAPAPAAQPPAAAAPAKASAAARSAAAPRPAAPAAPAPSTDAAPAPSAPPAAASAAAASAAKPAAAEVTVDSYTFGGLEARAIGPAATAGRIAAIDAVPGTADTPTTYYVGGADGGVWRSRDGGTTWTPVFDEQTQSIGAIAVDPQQPKTVWVGTGESWTRNSVSIGDGVYRSSDGGDSWEHLGLEKSERIARIAVDPKASAVVWVCATGHLWSDNEERGVYKTTDGGKSWKRVLYVDAATGCSDLAVDPQDSRILYAGMWQFRRTPWSFRSGGPGSGLFKSSDGGETWRPLKQGLPTGGKGRVAVAVAPSRPAVVYALVETKHTALYRSDDTGESWHEVNSSFNVQARPFYFARIVVDPTDFNYVYKPGLNLTVSTDGGNTFNSLFGGGFFGSVHSDMHALWINPRNPQELLLGTDGGVYASADRAHRWRFVKALPLAQFYQVAYDNKWPYNVYGGLQDNGSWMGPSRGFAGIGNRDWRNIGTGDGFWAFPDRDNPDIVYSEYQGGHASRIRLSTAEAKEIRPLPEPGDPEYRYSWNTPLYSSPTQPSTIYIGAQFLFRSRDRGDSWEKISPDLTTNDRSKQQQGSSGGLTVDNSSAETHTTIYAVAESPKDPNLIWVGTDDGNLQITRDGGKSWTNVVKNVPGLPAGTWVSRVEAGHYDAGTAYATFDNHHNGDMKTYAYRTVDFGRSWTPLADALAAGYAHVLREDLENPRLLFLGTELGLYISIDGGAHWARFTGGFPKVAVRDVAIHPRESDLIIATHGRGIYILDDISPLRKLTSELLQADVAMLPSRPAPMVIPPSLQEFSGDDEFVGNNPEEAATITYYLKKRHVVGELRIDVYNDKGELIASLPGAKRRGINRVAWPMRLPPPHMPSANSIVEQQYSLFGPRVPAGTYNVKLVTDDKTYPAQVQLVPDARAGYSAEDRAVQQQTVMLLYKMLERLTYLDDAVTGAAEQATKQAAGLKPGDRRGAQLMKTAERLTALHESLVATREGGWLSGEEELREKLGQLYGAINGYEGRPSQSQLHQVQVLSARHDKAVSQLDGLRSEVAAANRSLSGRDDAPIKVLTWDEWQRRQKKEGVKSGSSGGLVDLRWRGSAVPMGGWMWQPIAAPAGVERD